MTAEPPLPQDSMTSTRIHASLVSIERLDGSKAGVLIQGAPGAGKSSLALRLIDGGGWLVADDRVSVTVRDGGLWGEAPAETAGLIEARGVGLLRLPYEPVARIALAVDLVAQADEERMPERRWYQPPEALRARGGALRIPLLRIWGQDPAAAAKVRAAGLGRIE